MKQPTFEEVAKLACVSTTAVFLSLKTTKRASATTRYRWLYALLTIVLVVTTAPLTPISAAPLTPISDQNDVSPPEDGVVSPDGKRIAWVSHDGQSIWSAKRRSASGQSPVWGSPERLLTIRGTVHNLVFSPDSKSIAFENQRNSGTNQSFASHGFIAIYSLQTDRISFADPSFGTDIEPEWSNDGKHISFVRKVEGVQDEHMTVPVPTSGSSPPEMRPPEPFSLDSLLAAPFVSELTSSGDGQAVAYMAREATDRNIYFMPIGEDARRVVNYPDDDGQELSQVAVSQHGGAIAYVRGGSPNSQGEIPNPRSLPTPPQRQVWIADPTDGTQHLLGTGSSPQFSPDDGRVVWIDRQSFMSASLSWQNGQLRGVGDPEELFTFKGSIQMIRFSPNGERIAYQRASGIELYDFSSGSTSRISPPDTRLDDPSWSPDGSRIAFRQSVSGQPWGIGLADVSTLKVREVWQADSGRGSTFFGLAHQEDQLFWSDDDRIAFVWEGDGWRHLYAVPASGGTAKLLTPGDGEVENAATSMDHTKLIYSTNIGDLGRRHLWEVDFFGTAPTPITSGTASEWSPTPLADDKLAYIAAGWSDPTSVTVRNADGVTTPAALPQVAASFPADEMVEPQLVEFPASDGQTAYGQLFVPSPSDAKGCGIIFPHGGPRRQMLPGFHYIEIYTNLYELNQYLTNRGCVVLSVEYRSGVMYGYDFRNAEGRGRQGASEYRDILGAATYLQNHQDVDPDRLGIYGLSWGGYITALGLARNSDIFKVGFDMAGVHEFFGDPFPYSPMADIDRWTSPVYLAHGDDDRNVDFSQGVFLAQALQSRRPNVELVQHVFPNETHDMYLTFENLVDLYEGGSEFLLDHLGASPSVSNMKTLVEYFEEEGEFENHKTALSLQTHLTAVGHYEDTGLMDKAVKHMNSFKLLLDHQKENDLISEKAYNILKDDAGYMIKKWQ